MLLQIRSEFDRKLKDAKKETERMDRFHKEHVEAIRAQLSEQEANIKLLTQIAEYFLPATELSKVWERSKFSEEERRWQVCVELRGDLFPFPSSICDDLRTPHLSSCPRFVLAVTGRMFNCQTKQMLQPRWFVF